MRVAVTAPQPAHLVRAWRARGYLTDGRLGWLLDDAAARWPDREALVEPGGRHTFAALAARSHAVAAALADAGVGRGDTVAWTLPNGADAVAVAAAVWRIGAVSAPVVTIYREHEWTYLLDVLRPAAVVAPAAHRGRSPADELDGVLAALGHEPAARLVAGRHRGWTSLDGLAPPDGGLAPEVEPSPADEPCLVLWTSGTTSAPKGVVQTPAALLHEMRMMASQWALTWLDAMYMASPLTHVTGLLQGLLVPAAVGARAVLADRWDPADAFDAIAREGVTFMAGATPFLQGLVEEHERRGADRSPLREYSCGGAAVPPSLVERAQAVGVAVHRAWGLSELPTATMAGRLDPLERRARTDGRVAPACAVQAVDDGRRPLGPGLEGELRCRGPERMAGYLDPSLNAEALDDDGWLYTGDLGVVDEDGWVSVTGRVKEVINRGGEKLSARDIEDVLAAHPSVAEVAVVGVPGGRLGERVCAVVVPAAGHDVEPAELARYLESRRVARQKIPEEFRRAGELPRTASGKVQKFRIVETWGAP